MFDGSKKIGSSPAERALAQEKHKTMSLKNEISQLNGVIRELRTEIAYLKNQLRISPKSLNFKEKNK